MSVKIEDPLLQTYIEESWPGLSVTLIPYPSFVNPTMFVMKIEGELKDCSGTRFLPFTYMKTKKDGVDLHNSLKEFGQTTNVTKGICEELVTKLLDEMNIPHNFASLRQVPDDMRAKMEEKGAVHVVMYNVLVCEGGTIYHRYI